MSQSLDRLIDRIAQQLTAGQPSAEFTTRVLARITEVGHGSK
jgi:archaellum biogenesis protein FlaJ (TadC family)